MLILLAGSSGEVGCDLVKYFQKNSDIVCLERNKILILRKNKKKIIINTNPYKFLSKKKYEFDLYINCIAVHEFSKIKNKNNFFQSNVNVPKKLVKIFNLQREKSIFVNLSTVRVSELELSKSNIKKSKYTEIYAKTKKRGEIEFKRCNQNYVNLRLPGIITTQPNLDRPWLSKIINSINKNKDIKLYNLNKKFNNFIDTYEIFLILKNLIKLKKINGTFEVSPSNPDKLCNLLKLVIKYFKSSSEIKHLKQVHDHRLVNNKIFTKKSGIKLNTTKNILKRILKNYV